MADGSPKRPWPENNIDWVAFPELTWKSDGDIANGLTSLYKHAEARAESTIGWYLRAKASKSFNSRMLRLLTILLGTIGGLAPIIDTAGLAGWLPLGAEPTEIGYLMLGLAAACVAVDKLFGFSSGWMRYITTAMALQQDLSHLRMDWAMTMVSSRSNPLSTSDILNHLARLRLFLETIDGRVMQETRDWIAEFQNTLADIERAAVSGRGNPPGRAITEGVSVQPSLTGGKAQADAPMVDTQTEPSKSMSTSTTTPDASPDPASTPSPPLSAPLP